MAKKSFYKIEMLFLKVLEQEDCYGYQLTQSIQDITNGQIKIAEGTMYPILYKLQDKGYISDRQVNTWLLSNDWCYSSCLRAKEVKTIRRGAYYDNSK